MMQFCSAHLFSIAINLRRFIYCHWQSLAFLIIDVLLNLSLCNGFLLFVMFISRIQSLWSVFSVANPYLVKQIWRCADTDHFSVSAADMQNLESNRYRVV